MAIKKRIIAFVVAVAMAIGLVSSVVFIAENAEHNCSGVDCQICDLVQSNLKFFDNQTPNPNAPVYTLVVFWALVLVIGLKHKVCKMDTLVSLKTKLSN